MDLADFAGTMARIFEPNPLLLERLARRAAAVVEVDDATVLDVDVEVADVIEDDTAAADSQVPQSVSSMRNCCAPSCSTRRPSSRNSAAPSTIVAK